MNRCPWPQDPVRQCCRRSASRPSHRPRGEQAGRAPQPQGLCNVCDSRLQILATRADRAPERSELDIRPIALIITAAAQSWLLVAVEIGFRRCLGAEITRQIAHVMCAASVAV